MRLQGMGIDQVYTYLLRLLLISAICSWKKYATACMHEHVPLEDLRIWAHGGLPQLGLG